MTIVDDFIAVWRRRYRVRVAQGGSQPAHAADGTPVVVVTGASEGIGRAFAEELVARGDTVALVARDEAKLAAVASGLGAPERVSYLALDVTAADAADRIRAHVAQRGGYVDLLINNAGFGLSGNFAEHDARRLDELVTLNVGAATRLMHAVLPGMLERGRGGVINVASLGGYGPGPYQAAYYASKAYVVSLSEAVAHEIRGQGVHVMAVAPGPVETMFHAKMGTERALYRLLIPPVTATHVARSALFGFRLGRKVVLPGVIAPLLMAAVRITPHPVSMPLLALLLWPRAGA